MNAILAIIAWFFFLLLTTIGLFVVAFFAISTFIYLELEELYYALKSSVTRFMRRSF